MENEQKLCIPKIPFGHSGDPSDFTLFGNNIEDSILDKNSSAEKEYTQVSSIFKENRERNTDGLGKRHCNISSSEYLQGESSSWPNRSSPIPVSNTSPKDGVSQMNQTFKKILEFKSCKLYPPKPGDTEYSTRTKPPGCKTVCARGLPRCVSKHTMREIFKVYGKIKDLKMEKDCCYIQFVEESSVDPAMSLSGFRIVMQDRLGGLISRLICMDYAKEEGGQGLSQVSDDLQPTVDKVQHPEVQAVICTESALTNAFAVIKQRDKFTDAVQLLISWLEKGDCNTKRYQKFFEMIAIAKNHVDRLLALRKKLLDDTNKSTFQRREEADEISSQISHIEMLYTTICQKKVMDRFSVAQRRILHSERLNSDISGTLDCETPLIHGSG
nr:ecto-NOX disulfide-thiol exchanger 1-like [Leptinotarsa decemlineata]